MWIIGLQFLGLALLIIAAIITVVRVSRKLIKKGTPSASHNRQSKPCKHKWIYEKDIQMYVCSCGATRTLEHGLRLP